MVTITVNSHQARLTLQRLRDRVGSLAVGLKPFVNQYALGVLADAKRQTPIDEGTLRRSGTSNVTMQAGDLAARVQFGGLASAYALAQHEREDYTHTREAWAAKYNRRASSNLARRKHVEVWRKDGKGEMQVRGHKGGTHHFLEGRAWSAWNDQADARFRDRLEQEAARQLAQALTGGRGD